MKKPATNTTMKTRQSGEELYNRLFWEKTSGIPLETALVLHLHYRYGQPLKVIAGIMGKSLSVIYNHHHRGVYLLEKTLSLQQERTAD